MMDEFTDGILNKPVSVIHALAPPGSWIVLLCDSKVGGWGVADNSRVNCPECKRLLAEVTP